MLRKIDISKRLGLLVVVGLVMTVLMGGWMLWTFESGFALFASETTTQDGTRAMQVHLKTQVQEWKNILLRGSDPEAYAKHRDAFFAEEKAVQDSAATLIKAANDPATAALLEKFAGAHRTMGEGYRASLKAFAAGGGQDPATSDKMVKGQDRAPNEALEELVKHEADKASADTRAVVNTGRRGLLIASVVLGVLYLLFGLSLARSITTPIAGVEKAIAELAKGDLSAHIEDRSSDELGRMTRSLDLAVTSIRGVMSEVAQSALAVRDSSQQLSAGAGQISSGAQEQASSLEETAASLEEITSTVKQNADNAQQANQLANGSREVAEKGGRVVSTAVEAMAAINQSSKQIADIIGTIDEIAFQTNLLALNAAVEAARAGEQGRGFAVVATEVRNLAQRSATSAKEIKNLIQDSVRKVEGGTELVNQSGQTLSEIVTSVKRVTDIVSEIAAASREQSSGIDQVNKAVTQMDQVTQSNASQTEELNATAEGLASQAEQLQTLVSRFKLGGQGTKGAVARTAAKAGGGRPEKRAAAGPVAKAVAPAQGGNEWEKGFEEY